MPPTKSKNKAKTLLKSLLSSTSSTLGCGGCGSSSRRRHLNLPDVHLPLPKPQPTSPPSLSSHQNPSSTTTTTDVGECTSTTFSHDIHNDNDNYTYSSDPETDPQPSRDPTFDPKTLPRASNSSSRLGETFAVVQDSDDPYLDFKHSMLQIIFEKEMFNKQDLQELLACFLRLNSSSHHAAIIRAFSEIWRAVMSPENAAVAEKVRCTTKKEG